MEQLTPSSGRSYIKYDNSMSAGACGPPLLKKYFLCDDLADSNREHIPEGMSAVTGAAVFGEFEVTHDITRYTKAKIFSTIGKKTKVFAGFSRVGLEDGIIDRERDSCGFVLKFFTEDGDWDLMGFNTPVFFIKDPMKIPHFIHSQQRDPLTRCKSPTAMWEFWSLNPESLHQVLILMSDRGTPFSYRNMHGFGGHTFSLINKDNLRVWVRFHLTSIQDIKNCTGREANEIHTIDPDYARQDLESAIVRHDFPRWAMAIQVMSDEQAHAFRWNPFDLTKVWGQDEFPLIPVGTLELNEIPDNNFSDADQTECTPTHVVDGIGYSPDPMLQGRIISHPDAHRYRYGGNRKNIPVNTFPYDVAIIQREGKMQSESPDADRYDNNDGTDDHYSQPGALYRDAMNDHDRSILADNIGSSMAGIEGGLKEDIIKRQLCHFFFVDKHLAFAIAARLGVSIHEKEMVNVMTNLRNAACWTGC